MVVLVVIIMFVLCFVVVWVFLLEGNDVNYFNFQCGLLWVCVVIIVNFFVGVVQVQEIIKIGEINSYKVQFVFLELYCWGWEMVLDEVNVVGGVLGKKLEVIVCDDNGNLGDLVCVVEELMVCECVVLFFGGFFFNIGLVFIDYVKQYKVFFLVVELLIDKIVWQNGNKYIYCLCFLIYMLVVFVVKEVVKLKKKCWVIVYFNYEYGQFVVVSFKILFK